MRLREPSDFLDVNSKAEADVFGVHNVGLAVDFGVVVRHVGHAAQSFDNGVGNDVSEADFAVASAAQSGC